MGLEDQCRKHDPVVDNAVDKVVKDMRFHNSAAAAAEVENFWMQHHGDKEWNAFMNELNDREQADPKLKALFNDFHIIEEDRGATAIEVEYIDHGVQRDDKLHTTPLSDVISHLHDPIPPGFPPHPGHMQDPAQPGLPTRPGELVPYPPKPYPGNLTPQTGGSETERQ